MRLGQTIHRRGPFADHHVAGLDGVVGDFAFVQRREQATFADDKRGASRVGFAQKIGRIQRGRIKVPRIQPMNAEVFQPHGQSFGRGGRVVGQKEERCAGGD